MERKEIIDHVGVWKNCLQIIKDNISPRSFQTWFEPIMPLKLEDNILTIQVPTHFFYEYIEEHFISLIKKTIRKEIGSKGKLEYSIKMDNNAGVSHNSSIKMPTAYKNAIKNPDVTMPIDINKNKTREIPNPFIIPGLKKINIQSQLIDTLNFDNFVEGDCNRLARSAGYAVAQNPGKTAFNPLFLYSNVGLGKTHLAHAIGVQVKEEHPEKIVLYINSEQFIQQFIDSIKNGNHNDFIHFYQMIDVLIIDDIHFLAGKEKTQDAFFHIFNHLHQKGKQLIITSDKSPVDMVGFEQRLLSRFKWGLAADLQVPDLETRMAILRKRFYNDGIEMPDDVVEYIAYNVSTNVRELYGAITSIMAQASLNKKPITTALAKQMIDKYVKSTTREISIDYIQKIVCDYFGIPVDQIASKTRKREIVQVRQLSMYFAKKMTNSSLSTIGQHCGKKDHATVLHACRTINNLIETDPKFRANVEEIHKKIQI